MDDIAETGQSNDPSNPLYDVLQKLVSHERAFPKKLEKEGETTQIDQTIEIWSADIQKFISTLSRIDEEITSALTFQKDRTSKQINNLYREKDRVRRYNLNSVR